MVNDSLGVTGRIIVVGRHAETKKVLFADSYCNTVFDVFISAMVKDYVKGTQASIIKVLAFSRDANAYIPGQDIQPSALTNEFRASARVYNSSNSMQVVASMAAQEGNGSGNIKACGFYFGTSAIEDLLTGTLGSIVTGMNVEKSALIELSFTYEIEFRSS